MILKREKEMMFFGLSAEEHSMRGVGLFLFIYLGATLVASILTPPVYWAVEWLHSVNPSETTTWLLGKRLDIFYDRIRWVPIIIGFPWMMKECGLFSLSNLGLRFDRHSLLSFIGFFAFGIALAAGIFGLQWAFGVSSPDPEFEKSAIISALCGALAGALVVAFLEEIIMRGLIMRSFYTASGPITAIILSSLFFAYKHFKVPASIWSHLPGGGSATWDMGFFVAWYDTVGIAYNFSFTQFAGLFMFGAFLCILYIKTKSLWPCIGFHGGLVFCLMMYRKVFDITQNGPRGILGGAGMTDGWLALGILTIMCAAALFWGGDRAEEK